jgi:hypothetical protein
MKTKTTPEKNQKTIEALKKMTDEAGQVLFDKATIVYACLTDDERQRFSQHGTQFYRAAKILMVAVADEIEWQFTDEAINEDINEAIKKDIKAVQKIRRQRYC